MNYPNQLDDKNSLFEVKDLGRTSTSKPLNAVELEIEIDNPVNFPTGRHIVVVESEVIIISHRIDNILYVEKRGAFDTLSENHITNSKIGVVFTSAHYETLRDSIIDIQKEILKEIKKHNEDLNNTISTTKRINNFCKNCGAAIQPNETECAKCGVKS